MANPDEKLKTYSFESVEKLLSNESRFELRVLKAFQEEVGKPFTSLALVDSKEYAHLRKALITTYGKKWSNLVYISINNGFSKFLSEFENDKELLEKIVFIDMISPLKNDRFKKADVSFLESPTKLIDCIAHIGKKLDGTKKKETLVLLDSVSLLGIYNNAAKTEKFVHSLLGKINDSEASAILLSSDIKSNEAMTKTISQFVDKTVVL